MTGNLEEWFLTLPSSAGVQRAQEAGGTGWQEPEKGEQGEMHSPAPGLLVARRLGSSFAIKDLGLLVDSKLNMRQQHRRQTASRAASGRALAAGQCQQGDDPSFALGTSGVPCAASHYEKLDNQNLTTQPALLDLAWAGHWTRQSPEVPSSLNHPVSLRDLFPTCRVGWHLFWAETSDWKLFKTNLT